MKMRRYFLHALLLLTSVSLSQTPSPKYLASPSKVSKKEAKGDGTTLRIFNWEDYIALPEDDEGIDVLAAFQDYYFEEYGEQIEIVYDTFTTNEDMYNIMKLNGDNYDLIAPSDYMIERMRREGMLETFDQDEDGAYTKLPNYEEFVSPYHRNLFVDNGWDAYAVGYMWGTMGLLFNTETSETIFEDMSDWSILWDSQYKKKIALKDSMREAYLVGLLYVHHDELYELKDEHAEGLISDEEYNHTINELLNDTSEETIEAVDQALRLLKNNIYGLEVDQGKTDIVKGTIAINTAWSGDAVFSMYQAAEELEQDVLRYVIPEEGSNIWFDGWVMPKGANKALAQEFVNFVSNPEIAVANMDYIGYTTFIAGQDVMDYIYDYDEISEEEDAHTIDLRYFFEGTIDDLDEALVPLSDEFIGGQLAAQFPTYEEVIRSAVMRDFGDANNLVVVMWANFKATEIQNWMIVFSIIVVLGVGTLFAHNLVIRSKAARRKRHLGR